MTAFEDWWGGYFHEINSQKATALAAWKAAKKDSEAEIANLVAKVDRLTSDLTALKPHPDCDISCMFSCSGEALLTLPQSLVEHDNEVIERCIKVCDCGCICAEAIRELKGK
jgi:hypothetical protein